MSSAKDYGLVLVTGATGFIASHIIKQLLEKGVKVRGTVRSLENEAKVGFLKQLVPNASSNLELVEADLLKDETWAPAVKGVKYVIHVASPFPMGVPSNPEEQLIKPAVEGTKSVLKAASESGTVKRIVLTSSIAAVYDACLPYPKENAESKVFDETSWTDVENEQLDPYAKSKTLAEMAAWDFIKSLPDDKKIELVTINPGYVFGPLLTPMNSSSVEVIKRLMNRAAPAVPKLTCHVADVRDVASAHIKALKSVDAVGSRHIIMSKSLPIKEVSLILQREFKSQGYHLPTMVAPNVFVWLSSLIDRTYKVVVPRLSREYTYQNKRMTEALGIEPTDAEKSIIDTAKSLIEFDLIKKPKIKAKKGEAATSSAVSEEVPEAEKVNGGDKKE